MAIFEAEVTI